MLLAVELIAAAAVLLVPAREPAGPLMVGDHRAVDLVNLGGAPAEALLGRIAAGIGTAVDAVEAFWGTDWPHRITVVATGSDAQFAAQAGGGDAGRWAGVAAVAVADRVDPARRLAAGQRIVFAPGAAQMSPAALHIVLGHELFHFATRADTAIDAPRWLTEGVADFVARGRPAPADRPESPLTLPSDVDLDGPQGVQAYDRAWWFAGFVADRYGTAKLRELYLAACGPQRTDAATAVSHVLGVEPAGLLAGWQHWPAG